MLIDIRELRERDEPLEVHSDFTEMDLQVRNPIASLERPVHSEVAVSVAGERVRVLGRLDTALEVVCSRCLNHFHQPVEKRFDLEYWPDPEVEGEGAEIALRYPDLVIGFYRQDRLDLTAVISEQVVLEIPMKPVCSRDCKGLCDQCGANLNEGDCGCDRTRSDPRLEVLSEIKKRLIH